MGAAFGNCDGTTRENYLGILLGSAAQSYTYVYVGMYTLLFLYQYYIVDPGHDAEHGPEGDNDVLFQYMNWDDLQKWRSSELREVSVEDAARAIAGEQGQDPEAAVRKALDDVAIRQRAIRFNRTFDQQKEYDKKQAENQRHTVDEAVAIAQAHTSSAASQSHVPLRPVAKPAPGVAASGNSRA